MAKSEQQNDLSHKTDEEIQAELLSIKKKFYDRLDTQLEKDLIIEEREKLAAEKRNVNIQMEFLKQKMKKVYDDDLVIKDEFTPRERPAQDEKKEKIFYDITQNGPPVTPPIQYNENNDQQIVPQRKSRWHPEVGKVSGPDLTNIRSNIDNRNISYKPNTPRRGENFHDPFNNPAIMQIDHYGSHLLDTNSRSRNVSGRHHRDAHSPAKVRPMTNESKYDINQRHRNTKSLKTHQDDFSQPVNIDPFTDRSYQPHSRLSKKYYKIY